MGNEQQQNEIIPSSLDDELMETELTAGGWQRTPNDLWLHRMFGRQEMPLLDAIEIERIRDTSFTEEVSVYTKEELLGLLFKQKVEIKRLQNKLTAMRNSIPVSKEVPFMVTAGDSVTNEQFSTHMRVLAESIILIVDLLKSRLNVLSSIASIQSISNDMRSIIEHSLLEEK